MERRQAHLYCTMVADKRRLTSRTPPARAELDGRVSIQMKTMARRIRKLEVGAGLIETEESRREREFAENVERRLAAGRARAGLPPRTLSDSERRELAGMSVEEILLRGRLRARDRTA